MGAGGSPEPQSGGVTCSRFKGVGVPAACGPACSLFSPAADYTGVCAVSSEALKIKARLSVPGCPALRAQPRPAAGLGQSERCGRALPSGSRPGAGASSEVPPRGAEHMFTTPLSAKAPGRDDKSTARWAGWAAGTERQLPTTPDPRLARGSARVS